MTTGNGETTSGDPGQPPKKKKRRWWKWAIPAVLLLIIGAAAGAGGESGSTGTTTETKTVENAPQQPQQTTPTDEKKTPPAETSPATCTKPCADSSGWIVEVKKFEYDVPSGNQFITPETGNVFVTIMVQFRNNAKSSKSATPFDFKLAAGGVERDPAITSPCEAWSSVDVSPGATFGPKCLGFEVASGNRSGTLKWRPGLVKTYDIPVG